LVWFGLVWFGLVWFGLVWFGFLFFVSIVLLLRRLRELRGTYRIAVRERPAL
jgi:hypothetical protein